MKNKYLAPNVEVIKIETDLLTASADEKDNFGSLGDWQSPFD